MADQFRYAHVGDRPLVLGQRLVKPGEEFDSAEPIASNANFEPRNDNAKAHQAAVDAADAELVKEHELERGLATGALIESEASADAGPKVKRSKKDSAAGGQEG